VQSYVFNMSKVPTGGTQYFQVTATSQIYSWAKPDVITISSSTATPTVMNTNALKFSVFQWLFQ
jgi:hypothetical protein